MAGLKGGKKKGKGKGRGGTRGKKDEDDEDLETRHQQQQDEWTAISAIYQEDFRLISERPFMEYSLTVHPHSAAGGVDEEHVSVELIVRYVDGYPNRPPKVKVLAKKGLGPNEIAELQQMLMNTTVQAAAKAREGRVMIFNLTEATQEYLSGHNAATSDAATWHSAQENIRVPEEGQLADEEARARADAGGDASLAASDWPDDSVDI
eukprot:jgi/Mesen1/3337/ME000191S02474